MGNRVHIHKTGAGIEVTNHCMLNYLGVQNTPRLAQMKIGLTVHDDNVFQEYHDKIIPRAVEYSTGILDYYFRGTICAGIVKTDDDVPQFTVSFVNTSSQDFYNGTFYIYQDSDTGRTLVAQTNLVGTLASHDNVTATFAGFAPTNPLTIFYQGTIGASNNAALDPVDAGIAIAINSFKHMTTTNYWVSLDSLKLTNGATIQGTLYSDEFPFPLVPGNYRVTVNFAHFDDTGTIGSLTCTEGKSCTFVSDIVNADVPTADISISDDGRHLEVPISATDDATCGEYIGWGQPYSTNPVTITWQAWPQGSR